MSESKANARRESTARGEKVSNRGRIDVRLGMLFRLNSAFYNRKSLSFVPNQLGRQPRLLPHYSAKYVSCLFLKRMRLLSFHKCFVKIDATQLTVTVFHSSRYGTAISQRKSYLQKFSSFRVVKLCLLISV